MNKHVSLSSESNLVWEAYRERYAEPEPVRDWSFGLFTGHRVRVMAYMVGTIAFLYIFQDLVWPRAQQPITAFDHVWSWLCLLWLGAVIPGTLGLIGELQFRHPTGLDLELPLPTMVSWRIVSRGDNVQALTETIRRCQREMRKNPLFPYIIEVVIDTTDFTIDAPHSDVRIIRVPKEYTTPKGTRFKARALHYAMLHSSLPDGAYIVHLDEETQPTASGVRGIARMIREEEAERPTNPRIGQGAILYHRRWKEFPFLTLADNVRTGDDFARFHFQHQLGLTVFGLHGSFIVVRNDVEKASGGFDFGKHGEVTEDAFWAMEVMEQKRRCRWVEGYLEEQATQSLLDFLKQRRRWWQGLAKVSLYAPVRWRWKFCLTINTILWALAPFAMLYTIAHLFYGFEVQPWIRALANYAFATFVVLYLMGLKANLDEHGITTPHVRWFWWVAQVVLLPVFSAMESAGVLWALFSRTSGFHVVKK